MRQTVMSFGDTNLRSITRTLLDAEYYRDHACGVGLERQGKQVKHYVRMLDEIDGNAPRRCRRGCFYAVVALCILDAFFNIANGRQVFIEFTPVVSTQSILQPLCVAEHQVRHAFAILRLSLPFGWIL